MADNISNEYSMLNILTNVADNFFPNNLSTQRIGMFGFTTEAMARIFGAVVLDSNMRANEYHTITAKKMDTLLREAETLGLDISNARPSTVNAYLAFDVSQMMRNDYCNDDDTNDYKTYYFIIEKDTNINIAGYNFMLEYDILVTARYNDNEYVYSARYLSTDDVDPHNNDMCRGFTYSYSPTLTELNDKYIQSNLVTSGGVTLLMMNVDLRQMSKKYEYYTVIENDMVTLTGLEFPYDDYLAFFNVFYRENNNSDWEYIPAISAFDSSEYSSKTIQYSVDQDSRIITLNAIKFEPKYNAEYRVDIYTTKGSRGNITYSGDGSDIVCNLMSYDDRHSYSGIDMSCMPIGNAYGGTDTPTLEEVRANVIRTKASKNSLTTEYDLYNYLKSRDAVNDYFFVKKRSDILELIFSTYMLPRDQKDNIIPTSTLDMILKINNPDTPGSEAYGINNSNSAISIVAGTPFNVTDDENLINVAIHDFNLLDSNKRFLLSNYTDIYHEDGSRMTNDEIAAKESEIKLFALPYTIVYDKENQVESMYLTSISKSCTMSWQNTSYNNLVESPSNFALDHINITRNSFSGESYYTIKASVMANGDYSNCVSDDGTYTEKLKDAFMLKGFIYNTVSDNSGTQSSAPVAFFNFVLDSFSNGIFNFTAKINITDMMEISETNKIISPDSLYLIHDIGEDDLSGDDYMANVNASENVPIDVFGLKLGIGAYYISEHVDIEQVDKAPKPSLVLVGNSAQVDANGYPLFKYGDIDYILTDVYMNTSDPIDLYVDMSYIIRSTVEHKFLYRLDENNNKIPVLDDNDEPVLNANGDPVYELDTSCMYLYFHDIPVVQYSKSIKDDISYSLYSSISNLKNVLTYINRQLDNSFTIDYKFFRTYGPCQYFKLEKTNSTDKEDLGNLDISMEFNARLRSGITATDNDIITEIKYFLKSYIERINTQDGDYTIYMSNIITELENRFSDVLRSIDLVDLNGKGDLYRVLYYDKPDISAYSANVNKDELKYFTPEYINLPLENIKINIIR